MIVADLYVVTGKVSTIYCYVIKTGCRAASAVCSMFLFKTYAFMPCIKESGRSGYFMGTQDNEGNLTWAKLFKYFAKKITLFKIQKCIAVFFWGKGLDLGNRHIVEEVGVLRL